MKIAHKKGDTPGFGEKNNELTAKFIMTFIIVSCTEKGDRPRQENVSQGAGIEGDTDN